GAGTTVTDGTNTSNYGAEGLTFLDTNGDPLANTPSITATGIDAGNTVITSVQSGLGGVDIADATGNTLTNATNVGDLQNATAGLTNAGLNFIGDSGN
ncbi:hypothetical protein R0K30_21440, partial [Bacillus sp. SIMBA_154]